MIINSQQLGEDDATFQPAFFVQIILASLSVLGTFFVLFVFVCYKNLRNWAFEIIFYLCLAAMINSISYMLYYVQFDDTSEDLNIQRCQTQAFIMIWFENSQFLWAMLLGFSIYESIVLSKDDENADEASACKRIVYLIIGFCVPLLFSVFAIAFDMIGPMGNWCWIGELDHKNNNSANFSKDITLPQSVVIVSSILIGFNFLVLILNWYFIYSTIKQLYDTYSYSKESKEIISVYTNKIVTYPLIQTVCMFPGLLNKILICFAEKEYQVLNIIQALFLSSQGLWYALFYGCNKQVKGAIKETYERRLCCKKERTISEQNSKHLEDTDSIKSQRIISEQLDEYKY